MCPNPLEVALFFPRITVHSGGVERTLKVIEYSDQVGIRFTAFISPDVIRSPEVMRRLESLTQSDRLRLRSPGSNRSDPVSYDAILIPSEFWLPALKRARKEGIKAPVFIEFHQLPYIGTFDVLKTIGVDQPGTLDLFRLPFVASKVLGDVVPFFAFQTFACVSSVRSLSRFRDGHVMAVTGVTSKNLQALGYDGRLFVPKVHVGIEPDSIRPTNGSKPEIQYDGVYVGRFHPHKGFLDLPRIVARMKKALGRKVNIAVCGSPQFPRHLAAFEKRAKAFGVEENLTMLQWLPRDELYATIRRSRVLLYPSYVDAFSITVLESLCLGVPVLAYGIDALEMIWSDKRGVFLSPVGDTDALATKYAELDHESRFEDARREARKQVGRMVEEFSWGRAVEEERVFLERG